MLVRALGEVVRVDVSTLSADEQSEIARLWAWCRPAEHAEAASTKAQSHSEIELVRPGAGPYQGKTSATVIDVSEWGTAVTRLSRAVTVTALRRRIGQDLLFHAAGLASPDGRVLVLVGPSGTGKTTAASTLGTRLGYVSDESVAIRRDGTVAAYPKPLSLVRPSPARGKEEVPPARAGLLEPAAGLRLGRIVLLSRDPAHTGPPAVDRVDLLEATAAAAAQTSGLLELEAPLEWLTRAMLTGGSPVRLRYREIGDCLDAVVSLLAERSEPSPTWTHHPPSTAPPAPTVDALPRPPLADRPTWGRAPYVDAIELEGRVLVLTRGGNTLLAGVGATAWLLAGRPVTADEVQAAATGVYGAHDEADTLVGAAIQELARRRLLSRVT